MIIIVVAEFSIEKNTHVYNTYMCIKYIIHRNSLSKIDRKTKNNKTQRKQNIWLLLQSYSWLERFINLDLMWARTTIYNIQIT